MMPDEFNMSVTGDREIIAKLTYFKDIHQSGKLNQAMLDSALVVERKAKQNLQEMVYSQPEIGYVRTQFLFNKTMATGKVMVYASGIVTAVGSFIYYAKTVHFGLGRGRNAFPRPYLTKALQDAKEKVLQILKKAIL